MSDLNDFIHCYENIIDLQVCEKIIDQSQNLDFTKGTTTDGELSDLRKCYMRDVEKEFEDYIFKGVGKVLEKYSEQHKNFYTGLTMEDTGYTHLIYLGSEKGEYKEHVDQYDLHPRVLSCSFILNENYQGGDFSFFNGAYVVPKKVGSAVVFPSNFCFPHAVTPVSNGNRHSIITWMH